MAQAAEPVRLKQMYKNLRPMLARIVSRISFDSDVELYRIINENPKLLHVMSHGPMLGPWPAAAYLAKKAVDNGGGERIPFAQFHRFFFDVPLMKSMIERTFNSWRPFSVEEIIDQFQSGNFTDFMVLPEGDNCNFGNLNYTRPFRSHRYIEIAIRAQAPLLITVHRGTEDWAISARLDDFTMRSLSLLLPALHSRLEDSRILNIQSIPIQIPYLRVKSSLYRPELTADDLAEDPLKRRSQIRHESLKVQEKMNQMLSELDRLGARPHPSEQVEDLQATASNEPPAEPAAAHQNNASQPQEAR